MYNICTNFPQFESDKCCIYGKHCSEKIIVVKAFCLLNAVSNYKFNVKEMTPSLVKHFIRGDQ